ncbi:MAG: hypothetical protein OHK0022_26990 [Roseiflexaceae bacterium]
MLDSEKYFQVELIGLEVRLRKINVRRNTLSGRYDVLVGENWVTLDIDEPLISTGGPPIRSIDLCGFGQEAEQIFLLEDHLYTHGGPVRKRDVAGELFEVKFEGIISTLFATGEFLIDGDEDEFSCRIKISEEKLITGFAMADRRRGKRVLHIFDLPSDEKTALIRAALQREDILIERML